MKKLIFILILFFTSILVTNAASCKVISGDGTNIGDEIQCGTENFYVLSNDGKEIKMLAKYNLYIGRTYYKILFEQSFETIPEADYFWGENYSENTELVSYVRNESTEIIGAITYKNLEYKEVKQNELAIGAHGDLKVEPLFPEVAVYTYMYADESYDHLWENYIEPAYDDNESYFGGYKDFEINDKSTEPAYLLDYIIEYNDYLNSIEISTNNISILSVKEINDIVYQINGKELPLDEWWNNKDNWGRLGHHYNALIVGSIKEHVPEGYEWLWSTTYWTRTIEADDEYDLYFVDTMGDLCNADFCSVSLGAGIRPVVTIPAYLIYNIETKTDGNGTVEADHVEAEGGTEVKFTVTPKEGYVLGEVKVTDSQGNVVIFTDYTFTMPNANVLIEATFIPIPKEDNPDTVDKISLLTITILALGLVISHNNKKRISLN